MFSSFTPPITLLYRQKPDRTDPFVFLDRRPSAMSGMKSVAGCGAGMVGGRSSPHAARRRGATYLPCRWQCGGCGDRDRFSGAVLSPIRFQFSVCIRSLARFSGFSPARASGRSTGTTCARYGPPRSARRKTDRFCRHPVPGLLPALDRCASSAGAGSALAGPSSRRPLSAGGGGPVIPPGARGDLGRKRAVRSPLIHGCSDFSI